MSRTSSVVRYGLVELLFAALLFGAPLRPLHAASDTGGRQGGLRLPSHSPNDTCPRDDSTSTSSGGHRAGTSEGPIVFSRGSVIETAVDVGLPGLTFGWSHWRTYDSRLVATGGSELLGESGVRWHASTLNWHLWQDAVGNLHLYTHASTETLFKLNGAVYDPPKDYNVTFVKSGTGASEIFTLTELETGKIYIFYGTNTSVSANNRGRLKERTSREFQAFAPVKSGVQYTYNAAGHVSQVTLPQGWNVTYTYYSGGADDGRIRLVEVKNGAPTPAVIQKAEYWYYDSDFDPGTAGTQAADIDVGTTGDLAAVKVSKLASNGLWTERWTLYRYYDWSTLDGSPHQLKFVLEADAVQRLLDAGDASITNPLSIQRLPDFHLVAGTTRLDAYANRAFTYYTRDELTTAIDTPWTTGTTTENLHTKYGGSNLNEYDTTTGHGYVWTETINGACASCGGGAGSAGVKYTYFYINRNLGTTDTNKVEKIIVEDVEGSNGVAQYRRLYGVNPNGTILRDALIDDPNAGTLAAWCRSVKLNANLLTEEERMPSAHKWDGAKGVNTNALLIKFLDPTTGTNDADTVSTSSGAVYYNEYNADRYQTGVRVRKGSGTTLRHYVSATDWGDGTTGKPKWLPTATYRYPTRTETRSAGKATSFTYTFYPGGDKQVQTITTTLPVIITGQNGSGTATTTQEYRDAEGRIRWTKNGEGYVDYYSYHPSLGSLAYMMEDVNTASLPAEITSGSAGKWIAWSGSAGLTRGSLPAALQLVTKREFDDQDRETLTIDTRGTKHFTYYEVNRTLHYPAWNTTTNKPTLPIKARVENGGGVLIEEYEIDPVRTAQSGGAPTGLLASTTQAHYVAWTRYTHAKPKGQLREIDAYHLIPSSGVGVMTTNYHRTAYVYDAMGRQATTVNVVSGTATTNSVEQVTRQTFDDMGRVTTIEKGVSASGHDMTVNYTTLPTLTKVSETEYDGKAVGDNHVTRAVQYHGSGTNNSGTIFHRTFRGHVRGIEPFHTYNGTSDTKAGPFTVVDVNWEGRDTARGLYSTNPDWTNAVLAAADGYQNYAAATGTQTGRRALVEDLLDDLGRVYQRSNYTVTGGAKGSFFKTLVYYDRNDRAVGVSATNQMAVEFAYDGAGRHFTTRTALVLKGDDTGTYYTSGAYNYRNPQPDPWHRSTGLSLAGGDDKIVTMDHYVFDAAANAIEKHIYDAHHNDIDGIDVTAHDDYVRSSVYHWYDIADRLTTTGDYGSGNGASSPDTWKYNAPLARPATAPTASTDYVFVTRYAYHDSSTEADNDDSGRLRDVTDAENVITRALYDRLGRRTFLVENRTDFASPTTGIGGGTNADQDRVTKWEYNGLDEVTRLTAYNGSSASTQITEHQYADTIDASWPTLVKLPDGATTGSDNVKYTYDFDGAVKTRTDQRGTILEYGYDVLRRPAGQKANALGGADPNVQAITRGYDDLGRLAKVTSHGNLTLNPDDTTNVKNQLKFTYNDLSQLTKSEEAHSGLVGVGTPVVQYGYDLSAVGGVYDDGARLESVTYPDGRVIFYTFGGANALADRLNRIEQIRKASATGTILADYDHLGSGRLAHSDYGTTAGQPDVRNSYHAHDNDGDYEAYDRFGRVKYTDWYRYTGTITSVDQYDYTFDRVDNRKTRDLDSAAVSGAPTTRDQLYTYDKLRRIRNFDEGQLVGGGISAPISEQDWTLQQLDNWATFDKKVNGTFTLQQQRTHNAVNEIDTNNSHADTPGDSIGLQTMGAGANWIDPKYDAAGNLIEGPKPGAETTRHKYVYDAWDRLVKVQDNAGIDVATFAYDGLARRTQKVDKRNVPNKTYDYYYSFGWQVLEVHRDGVVADPLEQYVWHAYYLDAPLVRFYDVNTNNNIVEHYYVHDDQFNVTAVHNIAGTVLERYTYTPYGELTIMDASFTPIASSTIGNPCTFTGREYDVETGLYCFRSRYFAPHLGRFMNRDPAGYVDGLNVYAGYFAMWSGVDPYGLFWSEAWEFCKCPFSMIGGVGSDVLDTLKGIKDLLTTNPVDTAKDIYKAIEGLVKEIRKGNYDEALCSAFPNICKLAKDWDKMSISERCRQIGKVLPEIAGTLIAAGKIVQGPKLLEKLKGLAGDKPKTPPSTSPGSGTKPKPYSNPRNRPKYAEGQIEKVWENAKQPDGKVYDPNTGAELTWDPTKPRTRQWNMGHKPGKKYADLHKDYMDGKITKEEFLREYRDPNNYWPEDWLENQSHKWE